MLDALGKTADEVASTLGAKGVKGVANTVRDLNPIVRFIRHEMHDARSASLIGDMLTVDFVDGRQQQTPIPAAVRDFLQAFNRGQYPELHLPRKA